MATTTKAARPSYKCAECGWTTSKWVGRCGECQAWGTVDLAGAKSTGRTKASAVSQPAQPITSVDTTKSQSTTSGVRELDRVLGGGVGKSVV